MDALLGYKVDTSNIPVVINMMLKYGLIVRLEQPNSIISKQLFASDNFLVPALLPHRADYFFLEDDDWEGNVHKKSCYFVFSTRKMSIQKIYLPATLLKSDGFLPRGLMERLIGKAVAWSQLTLMSITDLLEQSKLYRNYAALSYGRQRFRLECLPDKNCIRLDIEGDHPLPVYNRINEQIEICVKECMGLLHFVSALQLIAPSVSETGFVLLSLDRARQFVASDQPLRFQGFPPVDHQYITNHYNSWLINTDLLDSYDVFLSHRWDKNDDIVADLLNDSLLGHTLGSDNRSVQIFYDRVRLKKGEQIQVAFGKALKISTIFVPILCTSALQRMLSHDPSKVDNVLIEWILALECMQNQGTAKIRWIYPVVFGNRNEDGSAGNIFAERVIDQLPDIIPTKSIEVVKCLLRDNKIKISPKLRIRTVRSVVDDLMNYNGIFCWEEPKNTYIPKASQNIIRLLNCL